MADWPICRGGTKYDQLGAIASTSLATTVTAGSANTDDGSWAALNNAAGSASCPLDADGFWLITDAMGDGTTASDFLLSIGIGASGEEKRIIDRLLLSRGTDTDGPAHNNCVWFPIPIPAGTRVTARIQSNVASATIRVMMLLRARNDFASSPPFGKLTSYGVVDSGATDGTACNSSAAHTRAWTELIASASSRARALYIAIGNRKNTARPYNQWMVSIAKGASGAEDNNIIIEHIYMVSTTGDDLIHTNVLGPFNVDISAGDRIAVGNRSQTNDGTDRQFSACLYLLE